MNEPSLSSASATSRSPRPSRAWLPSALTLPPITIVGSSPPSASTLATSEVVVVLPCAPAMATPYLSRISSPSISARGMTGMTLALAATTSGSAGVREEGRDRRSQRFAREPGIQDDRRGPGLLQDARIAFLVPVDRMGKGDQERGLPARRDLGYRRRARPAHDQIRLAKRPRDVKEERRNLSVESSVPVSHSDFIVIVLASLMNHPKARTLCCQRRECSDHGPI